MDFTAPIDTNRPTVTNSALVVPMGSVQLENGLLFQGLRHGKWRFDVPETQVRIGLFKRAEFQAFVPNAFVLQERQSVAGKVTSLTDLGFKLQMFSNNNRGNAALVAALTLPPGARQLSGKGVQPTFRMPWFFRIGKRNAIGGMQSVLLTNNGHDVQWQPTAMVSRAVGANTGGFIEYAGYFQSSTRPISLLHFGAIHRLTLRQQVDIHFGFGLNRNAPSAFVGTGYSCRFDVLDWFSRRSK